MRQHASALLGVLATLGTFYGSIAAGIPNPGEAAVSVAMGSIAAGVGLALIKPQFLFRLDTFMFGLVGGFFAIGFGLKQADIQLEPTPRAIPEQRASAPTKTGDVHTTLAFNLSVVSPTAIQQVPSSRVDGPSQPKRTFQIN